MIGILEAINPAARVFDPDALLVMTGLGSLAGTTIQNATLYAQLEQAHKRYHELFDDSIDSILITDWNGRVLESNRQASGLSGYSAEELHTRMIGQLHEVNWSKVGLGFEALRENDCTYESTLQGKDGLTVPMEVHARCVEFEDTNSIQWILRNITTRKELDRLRDDMTAMIYHDLRSPLGNIVSSLDMLQDMIPPEETSLSMLTIAQNSTGRIQRLVNSLLDINRLEAGQQVQDKVAIDPAALSRKPCGMWTQAPGAQPGHRETGCHRHADDPGGCGYDPPRTDQLARECDQVHACARTDRRRRQGGER